MSNDKKIFSKVRLGQHMEHRQLNVVYDMEALFVNPTKLKGYSTPYSAKAKEGYV